MSALHTSPKHTAACGVLVVGASWRDSGITLGLMVVDSSRRGFAGFVGALNPASNAGVANALFAPVFTG